MRYFKIGLLAVAGLLFLAVAGLIAFDWISQPAEPDRQIFFTQADQYHVRIKRDDFGVPHVFGKTDPDVAFGFAFAHCEDDFATIQEVTIATRGKLAAVEGRKAAVTDYLVHLLGIWDTVDKKYDRELPAYLKDVLNAYADGVNYYAALHPDKVARGIAAGDGARYRGGLRVQDAVFLWARPRASQADRTRAFNHSAGIERRCDFAAARGGWRYAAAGQFASALCGACGLVRSGAAKRRRAGMWRAGSFPARRSCCMGITRSSDGPIRSTRPISWMFIG